MIKWFKNPIAYMFLSVSVATLTGYFVGRQHIEPKTTYLSSMGIYDPVRGIIHVECFDGKGKAIKLDARSIGMTFDADKKVNILVELNDVPPNKYSPTSYWLKDAGLCKAYVR